ncbi:hypothetical protein HPB52_010210 [Rhipicephalus sanguineus]|uniref:Uncharacterized protein n=1 Tax=Rhipicephalus sanguineus TaxID=34632 RepID=A0A9D4T3E7_RHISA|nr:hypothetical protein HPB52_010210 [Rhipicephalus sanguineus]
MHHEAGQRSGDGSSRGYSCPSPLHHDSASCTSLAGDQERCSSACSSSVAVVGPGAGPAGAAGNVVLRLPAPPLTEGHRHRRRAVRHQRNGADTSCSGAHFTPSLIHLPIVDLNKRERI